MHILHGLRSSPPYPANDNQFRVCLRAGPVVFEKFAVPLDPRDAREAQTLNASLNRPLLRARGIFSP